MINTELMTKQTEVKTEPSLASAKNQNLINVIVFKLLSGDEILIRQEEIQPLSPVAREISTIPVADPNDGWGNHGLTAQGIYVYQGKPNQTESKYSQNFQKNHPESFRYITPKDAAFKEDW